jgi:hypothetical protein
MAEFRERALADHDGARLAQPRHQDVVTPRHVVREDRRAMRGANAGGLDLVLHVHRDAVQGPERRARHHRPLRVPRRRPRAVAHDGDQRIEPALLALRRGEHRVDIFHRRELAGADQRGRLDGGQEEQIVHCVPRNDGQ